MCACVYILKHMYVCVFSLAFAAVQDAIERVFLRLAKLRLSLAGLPDVLQCCIPALLSTSAGSEGKRKHRKVIDETVNARERERQREREGEGVRERGRERERERGRERERE